jgi:hypothetical protein
MMPEIERGSSISPSLENSLWRWLWVCKADYVMMMEMISLSQYLSVLARYLTSQEEHLTIVHISVLFSISQIRRPGLSSSLTHLEIQTE